nr:MAG TPA: hypothetical protein [Caudoviricetes sp.]
MLMSFAIPSCCLIIGQSCEARGGRRKNGGGVAKHYRQVARLFATVT